MTTIKDMNHLKELAGADGGIDVFISLAGGLARSSKTISYNKGDNTFDIFHDIDGEWEDDVTEEYLRQWTNIPDALDKGALYIY